LALPIFWKSGQGRLMQFWRWQSGALNTTGLSRFKRRLARFPDPLFQRERRVHRIAHNVKGWRYQIAKHRQNKPIQQGPNLAKGPKGD
jgi:hypothetical protein